jgi:hypothetical protein
MTDYKNKEQRLVALSLLFVIPATFALGYVWLFNEESAPGQPLYWGSVEPPGSAPVQGTSATASWPDDILSSVPTAPKIQQPGTVPEAVTVPPSQPIVAVTPAPTPVETDIASVKPAPVPKPPAETKREARARKRAKWLKAVAGTVAAVAEHKEEIGGGIKAVSEEIKRVKQEQKAREVESK